MKVLAGTLLAATLAACASRAPAPVVGGSTPPPSPSASSSSAPVDSNRRNRWLEMFARGYFPGRSGQVFFVPREGDFLVDTDPLYQFMHGSPWDYDTRIPLLLAGAPWVRSGSHLTEASQRDVAPTLAALLRTAPPATTRGRVLTEALADRSANEARPRVLALFVLDGMRADYFDRYAAEMPALSRLRGAGSWFANARINALPTATSIGHATLGTGTDPSVHGLVVNRLFNRVTAAAQESYKDLDPGELMALTLADVWNLATDGRARIIGQGGAIRATAGLVGHGACLVNGRKVLAASYTTRDGGWETNPTCYTLSPALSGFTAERYWQEAKGTWLGHDISNPSRFRASAVFQRFEGDALMRVLDAEPLGQDDETDLVLVNMKGPDYVSHAYGPDSQELRATLRELDRQIARVLELLERKAGARQTVVAIAADHGIPAEPTGTARRIQITDVVNAVNERFSPTGASVIEYFADAANAQMHLNRGQIEARGFLLRDVAAFLEQRFFAAAFTEDEVREAQQKPRTKD